MTTSAHEETSLAAPEPRLEMLGKPGYLVRRLHQICTLLFIELVKEFQLTAVQYGSLQVVEVYPGIDQARLGRLMALDRTTVSDVVRRLSTKGLIDRQQQNRRKTALYLTGVGRAMIRAARPPLATLDTMILAPLDAEERAYFMKLLTKLVDSADSPGRTPGRTREAHRT